MRTRVDVCARPGAGGRTALAVLRADGALAVRATGRGDDGRSARVHLVGTAAGPLGGDVVEVRVRVEEGAALVLRGVAATLALPHRDGGPSRVELHLDVAAGAALDVALEPVVVARGADLRALTHVRAGDGAHLDLAEQVLLGRWGEAAGRWHGEVRADLAGRPWLRQSVALGPAGAVWDALDAPRAYLSRLRSPAADARAGAGAAGRAVLLPLAGGGTLLESVGPDLPAARADAAAVEVAPEVAGSARGR